MTDAAAVPTPDTDPIAIVFPGQGSQAPGMGKLVHDHSEAARRTFEEASDVTGMDIAKICFESSEDALATTHNTQPAVLTTSIAIIRAMREEEDDSSITVRFEIVDTGIGIPASQRERIFEEFQRGSASERGAGGRAARLELRVPPSLLA